jgi:hypothetical protein
VCCLPSPGSLISFLRQACRPVRHQGVRTPVQSGDGQDGTRKWLFVPNMSPVRNPSAYELLTLIQEYGSSNTSCVIILSSETFYTVHI